METNEPNVYPTILGGVSRGFWSPFEDFGKSARFQVPKNGTSSAQLLEWSPKTLRNTPQNGGVNSWFMRVHFRASIKPIFENCKF